MALTPGTRLGVYDITAQIGEGGMGQVYRATDTKLKRQVAIKILPASLAGDADRLARFQREAELLASLNHPHIAVIYGLEESAGVSALVMELVEGEDLSRRIAGGPIPLEEALAIAKQIAEALEAAHEQGIIHRDLKPANIKVREDGTVKVLDFGLAKVMEPVGSPPNVSQSPTITTPAMMTGVGVILGTAAYMSPEQARGKTVDRRTDVWAFGCVLFEMLTGHRAFKGEQVSDVLASVLKTDPPWQALPTDTPVGLQRLLRRCLEKDPRRRLQAVGEARLQIEDLLSGAPDTTVGPAVSRLLPRWRRALPWMMALTVTILAAAAAWMLKPSPQPRVSRLTITLPAGDRLAGLDLPVVAISPDGSRLVYVATRGGGVPQLYLRAMDSLDARLIPGTDGATTPFFSPDGLWVGFFAGGKLKKISLSGGAALPLGDAVNPRGASWSALGTIAFGPTNASAVRLVSGDGGTSQLLKHSESPIMGQKWPEFLPDGGTLLFVSLGPQVVAHVLDTGEQRTLAPEGSAPRYARSGHLLYAQGGSLMAVPFDTKRLTVTGAGVPVVEGVAQSPSTGSAQYSLSNTGSLAYVTGGIRTAERRLVWVTRQGVEQLVPAPAHAFTRPQIAPDGRRIAVDLDSQVWLFDLVRNMLTPLTFSGAWINVFPLWTPDGKRIVFDSNQEGAANLFWQLADGNGGRERLATSRYTQAAQSWSADGQQLAYTEVNDVSGFDIWVLHLHDRKVEPFLATPATEAAPKFSPDGRWLAYQSNQSGHDEIYVQPYPGSGGKWQVSTGGGTEPMWNPNGRELFYRVGDRMTAVDITTQPSFSAGTHRVLFEGHYASRYPFTNYDVSADGQRFLMLKPSDEEPAPTQIIVVQNWFEELKARVPTGK